MEQVGLVTGDYAHLVHLGQTWEVALAGPSKVEEVKARPGRESSAGPFDERAQRRLSESAPRPSSLWIRQ